MRKILIVEDDTVLRENTAEFIKGQNFDVFIAEDGLIGVKQTLKYLPDLIVCDISMPNMNGYDFYKTIKQIKATATIPLVFLSARTEKEDIRAGMQLGADDYITKPFSLYELLKVIHTRLTKYDTLNQINDEKFQALIDHPTLGIYIYQNGKLLFYNNALANIFGYDYEEFSSVNFEELLNEKYCDKTEILNALDRCLKDSKASISLKLEAIHKTLNTVSIELFGSTITYKGQTSLAGNIVKLTSKNSPSIILKETINSPTKLSNRELEVLKLICKGKSTLETSKILFLGQRTIETYRAKLLNKTDSKNIAELMMYAIRNRLIVIE
ncbi:response regulator [Polaribacter sp. IC073]|uniref:response regulator n=1 Tax=Polaribacter sp. IC073 TaxID=2508540 RepID=UPI0011BEED8D|nr:response regulator [Polaribacter sp. IC073]TXD47636.1 response regulator transcription factor [Polaribacter sp. IC073]